MSTVFEVTVTKGIARLFDRTTPASQLAAAKTKALSAITKCKVNMTGIEPAAYETQQEQLAYTMM